eukprot:6325816-Amphidinium_carterae.1
MCWVVLVCPHNVLLELASLPHVKRNLHTQPFFATSQIYRQAFSDQACTHHQAARSAVREIVQKSGNRNPLLRTEEETFTALRPGLGWPAQCRLRKETFDGIMRGLMLLAQMPSTSSQQKCCSESPRPCAPRRRHVVSPPYNAWAMEHILNSLAGSTTPCQWQSGRPTASFVSSCLQQTWKRPGWPALTKSEWWRWGGPLHVACAILGALYKPPKAHLPSIWEMAKDLAACGITYLLNSKQAFDGVYKTPSVWILDSAISVLACECGLLADSTDGGYCPIECADLQLGLAAWLDRRPPTEQKWGSLSQAVWHCAGSLFTAPLTYATTDNRHSIIPSHWKAGIQSVDWNFDPRAGLRQPGWSGEGRPMQMVHSLAVPVEPPLPGNTEHGRLAGPSPLG